MKSINAIEVTLYLYESWALALSGFAGKVLAGDGLSSELKGALVEVQEALLEAKQTANQ